MPTCSLWTEGLPISVLEAMAQGCPSKRALSALPDFFQPEGWDFSPIGATRKCSRP